MFEKWIARQLMHLLGEYLEPSSFSTETVSVGVWSGYFVLDNVCLKQGLLDVAPLPVHMTHGSVARIELRIPWSNLTQEPIELTIHGVFIVFRAEGEDKRIPGKETKEARKQAFKKARLSSAYMRRIDSLENAGQQVKRLGMRFIERLMHRVLDSILIHVQGVHIRYEDAISNPLHPFCTGVTLASLHVHSTDKNSFPNSQETEHLPSKPKAAVPRLAKTLQLSHLSVYWNAAQLGSPCSMFVGEGLEEDTHDAVASIMHLLVPRPDLHSPPRVAGHLSHLPPLGHNYLLAPVDATVNILSFEGDAQSPATWTVNAHVGSIVVSIFDWQYQDILCMIAAQAQYEARLKYQAERPCVGVMMDPKAWWGYAIATAIEEVKRMRNNGMDCWDLKDIGRRRALRLEYISLWCSSINQQLGVRASSGGTTQHGVSPSYVETGNGQKSRQYCSRLEELENELSYDDIIVFRAMAQEKVLSELRVQRGGKPHQEKQATSVITSWVLWALGVHKEEGKGSVDCAIPPGSTDADFEYLYDIIDWHPTEELPPAATKSDYGIKRDILRLRLNFQLEYGSISIRCSDIEGFLDLRFSSLDVQYSVLGEKYDAIEVAVLLKDFGIHEIGTNDAERMILQRRRQDPEELELVSGPLIGGEGHNLLRITVSPHMEQHCNCDATISLDVGQVEIMLSPESVWMELISAFLEPPEFLEYWEGLELDAANALNSVAAQLEAKFHYFIDTRYRVIVNIDAKAPLIIIPVESGTAECITFDLGRITFNTQKLATPDPSANAIAAASIAEEKLSSSFSPSLSPSNELHFPPFHSLYDAYVMNVQHIELSYIAGDGMEYTLLNPLDMKIEVFVSVIPKDPTMTQLWIRGDLPEVHLRLNDSIMKRLIAAGKALSRKAHTTSDGAASSVVVSRTCDLSENERRDSHAMTLGTASNDGLESFLDFQRTIGEYVDHHINSNHVSLDMQSDKEGDASALIESIRSEEDEESFFDAISEEETSWSVCDEETSSSEKESSSLDIEGGEQCSSNVKVLENGNFQSQNCLSSQVGGVKEESKILSSGGGAAAGSEVNQSRLCDNHRHHLPGVENSYPVAQSPAAVLEHRDDCDSELCVLLKMAAAETQTQVIGGVHGLLGDTDLPVVLEVPSCEKVIASRNSIERRASSKSIGYIPLNRDILRGTFTLPLVNIKIVRSDRISPHDNIACNKTSKRNDMENNGDNDDDEPILNVEFTGTAVRIHVRTDDARVALSVRSFSIVDCLKKLRGDAPPSSTTIEEEEQYCYHLPPLVSNKGSSYMLSSELFRPYQWVPGRRRSDDGYFGGDELKSGASSSGVLSLSHSYLYNKRTSLAPAQEEGRSSDFLNLSIVISQPPEESISNSATTTTDVEKCKVTIDLNALEISIEQSSALAVLQLLENVLGTEEESSDDCHQDSLNQQHSVAAGGGSSDGDGGIKTPSQASSSTTQSFLKEAMEYFRSVRFDLGIITVYLIQNGIDIAAIGLSGAKCLLKTDASGKVHVLLKCTNLQILDLIAEGSNDDSIGNDSAVPESSQQQNHKTDYGISGSDDAESRRSYYGGLKSTPHHYYSRATIAQEVLGTMDENTPVLDVCFVTEIEQLIGEERTAAVPNYCEAEAISSSPSNLKIFVGCFRIVVPSPAFCERISSYLLCGPLFHYLIGKFGYSSLKIQTVTTATAAAETMSCNEEYLADVSTTTSSSWQIPSSGVYIEFEMKKPLIILPYPYHAKEKPVFFVLTFFQMFVGVALRPLQCEEKETTATSLHSDGGSGVLICIESALVGLSITFEPENEGVLLPCDFKLSMRYMQPPPLPRDIMVVELSPPTTMKNIISSSYDAMGMNGVERTLKDDGTFLWERLMDHLSHGKDEKSTRIKAFEIMRTPQHFLFTSWSANSNSNLANTTGVISTFATSGNLKLYSCNTHLETLLDCINYWSKCFKSIKQQYYDTMSDGSSSCSRNGFEEKDYHVQARVEGGDSSLVVCEAYLSVEALEFTLFSPCHSNSSSNTFQPPPPSSCGNDANEPSISQHYYAEEKRENEELELNLNLNVRDMMTTNNELHHSHYRTSVVAMKMEPIFYFVAMEIDIKAKYDSYGGGMVPALSSSSILKRCYKEGKENDNEKLWESFHSMLSLTVREAKATALGGGDGWSTNDEWQHRCTMQQQNNNRILTPETTTSSPPSLLHLQPLDVTGKGDDVTDGRHGLIIRIWDCKSSGHSGDQGNSINYNSKEALRIQCFMGGLSIAVLPQFICYAAPTIFNFLPLLSSIATAVADIAAAGKAATQTKKSTPIIRPALITLHVGSHGTKLWLPLEKNITPEGKSLLLSWCTSVAGEWNSSKSPHSAEAGALSMPFQGSITVKKCHLGTCRLKKIHHANIMSLPCGDVSYFEETLVWPFSCTATFTSTLPDLWIPSQSSLLLSNTFDMEMDIIEGTWHIDSSLPMKAWLVIVEPLISVKWGGPARWSAEEKASAETQTILPLSPPSLISKENVGICRSSDDQRRRLNKPSVVCDGETNNGGANASLIAPSRSSEEAASTTTPMMELEIGTTEPCPIVPLSKLYPWKVNVALQGMRIFGLHSSYGSGGKGVLKGTPVVLFELLQVKGGALIVGNEDVMSTGTTCPWSTANAWVESQIQADYYNRSSSAWEPLLEPWGARVDAKASWGAMSQHEHHHKQSHHHQPTLSDLSPPTRVNIEATAKQVLNVNMTEGLIDTIAGVLKALEKSPLNVASIVYHSNSPITANATTVLSTDDPNCDTRLQTSFVAGMIRNKAGVNIGVLCFSGKDVDMIMKDDPTKVNTKTKCCSEKLMMADHLLSTEREVLSGDSIPLEVTCTNREEATAPSTWWNQDSLLCGSQRGSGCDRGLFLHLSAHYPGYPSWRSTSPLYCTQVGCQEHLLLLYNNEGAIGSSNTTTCTSMLRLYVDVRVKAGDMLITVHSALRLANQTSVPLHVSLGSFLAMSSNIDRSCQEVAADWDIIIAPGRKEPVPAHLAAAALATSHASAFSIKPIREMEQDQADSFTVFTPLTIQLPSPQIVDNKGNEKRPGTHQGENTILDLQQSVLTHYCCELEFFPSSVGGMANIVSSQKMCCHASMTHTPQSGVEELLVCSPVCIRNFLAVSAEVEVSYMNEQQPKTLYQQQRVVTTVLPIDAGSTEMWTGCMPKDAFRFRVRMQGFDWSTQCTVQPSSVEVTTTTSSQWSTVQKPFIDGVKGNDESGIGTLCQLWVDTVNKCCKTKLRLRVEVSMDSLGVRYVAIWVPYWVVNSSGLPLQLALDKGAVGDRGGHGGGSATFSRTRGNSLFEQPLSAIAVDQNVQESSSVSVAPPLMMDYMTEPEEFNGRGYAFIRARVPGASWSSPFSCDQAGVEGALEIKGQQTSTILSWLLPNKRQKGAEAQTKNLVGHGSQAFALGLSIKVAEGGFHRTKVVTLVPRYIIVNQMVGPLQVNQALTHIGTKEMVIEGGSITVSSGGQAPWHWPLANGPRLLRCRIDEFGCEWSGRFDPSQIGDQNFRLFNKNAHTVGLCRVDVDLQGPIIYLVFHKASPNMAPYHIENSSVYTLTVGQVGCEQLETLEPYTGCAYAWDEPLGKRHLQIMIKKKDSKSCLLGLYPLDEVRIFNAASNLKIEVVAVGPTRVLRFTHHQISSFGHNHHRNNLSDEELPIGVGKLSSVSSGGGDAGAETETLGDSSSTRQTQKHRKRRRSTSFLHAIAGTVYERLTEEQPRIGMQQSQSLQTTTTHITLSVYLRGVGVSLVNATPRELLYISIGGIRIKFASEENQLQTISVTLQHLQVDNQFFKTPYPLLLYPLNAAISNASATAALDILHCTNSNSSNDIGEGLHVTMIVEQSSSGRGTDFSKIISVKLLRISLAPLDVNVDGALVMALLMMYSRVTQVLTLVDGSNGGVTGGVVGQNVITAEGVLSSLVPSLLYRYCPQTLPSAKMYFEKLIIDPIRVHASFRLKGACDTPNHVELEDENDGSVVTVRGSANGECYNVINGCVAASSVSARPSSSTSALILALLNSASIENVPLALNALVLTHTFSSTKDLGKWLTRHYQRQILFRAFKIIGSVELLGNPVAFLQNVASGVKDFLYEPVAGLREGSMKGFGLGVVKGTSSLLRRTTYSLAEALQLIAGKYSAFLLVSGYVPLSLPNPLPHRRCGGGGLTRLSYRCATGQYVTKEKWFQPSGIFSGMCLGLVGIVRDPLLGFVKGGLKGLITGMCRGGLGLLIRPAYGGLVTVESMGKYVSQFLYPTLGPAQKQRMQRVRPPRFFSRLHQPLTIFSQEGNDAGEELLRRTNHGRNLMEGYVWHEVVGTMIYLLTRQTLLVLNQTDSLFNPIVKVTIPLYCIVWAEVVEEGDDDGLCGIGIYDIDNVGDKMGFQGLRVRYTTLHTSLRKTLHELLGLIKHYSRSAELFRACSNRVPTHW